MGGECKTFGETFAQALIYRSRAWLMNGPTGIKEQLTVRRPVIQGSPARHWAHPWITNKGMVIFQMVEHEYGGSTTIR